MEYVFAPTSPGMGIDSREILWAAELIDLASVS